MFAKAILDGQKARAAQGIAQWIKTRAEITKPHTTTLGNKAFAEQDRQQGIMRCSPRLVSNYSQPASDNRSVV
jgi:hypothetical protein